MDMCRKFLEMGFHEASDVMQTTEMQKYDEDGNIKPQETRCTHL